MNQDEQTSLGMCLQLATLKIITLLVIVGLAVLPGIAVGVGLLPRAAVLLAVFTVPFCAKILCSQWAIDIVVYSQKTETGWTDEPASDAEPTQETA